MCYVTPFQILPFFSRKQLRCVRFGHPCFDEYEQMRDSEIMKLSSGVIVGPHRCPHRLWQRLSKFDLQMRAGPCSLTFASALLDVQRITGLVHPTLVAQYVYLYFLHPSSIPFLFL
ncbi:hypothetical protein AB6A40_002468 [Gnathostoma spinigerum]|uniref:Uncharacterized protein n=1 Tax=Gnathostoma spinigerum TaxID=75299 RepID=A0ABD6EC86_9BILA